MTTHHPETLGGNKEERFKEWLRTRGFRPIRWWEGEGYGPPFLQPGGIAPEGNTGDPEVRQRVLETRRARRFGRRLLNPDVLTD